MSHQSFGLFNASLIFQSSKDKLKNVQAIFKGFASAFPELPLVDSDGSKSSSKLTAELVAGGDRSAILELIWRCFLGASLRRCPSAAESPTGRLTEHCAAFISLRLGAKEGPVAADRLRRKAILTLSDALAALEPGAAVGEGEAAATRAHEKICALAELKIPKILPLSDPSALFQEKVRSSSPKCVVVCVCVCVA